MFQINRPRTTRRRNRVALALLGVVLFITPAIHAQKIYFEDFEGLPLGPNVDEALVGAQVWTSTPPEGWEWDASGIPGVGNPDLDGVTEWAGWGFADKVWWMTTAGDQRRTEFTLGSGTVAIADPDEWDDANHAPGLFNAYTTTSAINLQGQAANSLVLAFASSWRDEALDDGAPDFPVDANGNPINNQTAVISALYDANPPVEILRWDSVSGSPTFHDDNPNELVVIPLNNPEGAASLKLKLGLLESANDWWWAVDNLAVGVPPFANAVSGNGFSFTVRILEALGQTVNQSTVALELDGTPVSPLVVASVTGGVTVTYDQYPLVFTPGKTYTITVRFATGGGRQVVDTLQWTAPSFTTVTSTPTTLTAVITDTDYGLTVDETAGIQLVLDGSPITPGSITRTGTQLTLFYSQAPNIFPSSSAHTLAVTFQTAEGVSVTDSVDFTAPAWTAIPAALGTATGTGAEAGMRWRTHQLATARGNSIAEAEAQLAGTLGASVHDPNGYTTPQGTDGYFDVGWVNMVQAPLTETEGNFASDAAAPQNVPDDYIPGIPGLGPAASNTDYIAAEALTYLELPAGFYSMVVNSDDGFEVTVGTSRPGEQKYLSLGRFDGGRGASDTRFYFNIEQAGVYFFRLLWFEGGGGANVEWFTVDNSGARSLINGEQAGSLKAYRTRTVAEPELPAAAITGIGLNFGGDEAGGALAATDVAGVPGIAQANWNNLNTLAGTSSSIVGDASGSAQTTGVSVEWTCANTWASTGRGEENNGFTGADRSLMTGYLDTGADTTTTVTISGIPEDLTDGQYGYDVYVYTLGGVAGRGGGYRVVDPANGTPIRDYVKAQSAASPTSYSAVPTTDPAAWGVGTHVLFRALTASSIRIEATTVDPWGFGSPNRAPINAVQLVPATEPPPAEFTSIVINANGSITVTWEGLGVLESAPSVTGPWNIVEGATSPFTFDPDNAMLFGRIRSN
jgi:hypothetical protein